MIQSNSIFKHRPRNTSFSYLIINSYCVYNISISNYIVSTHHSIVHCLIYVLSLFIVGDSSPSTFMLTFHYWSPYLSLQLLVARSLLLAPTNNHFCFLFLAIYFLSVCVSL